MTSKHPRALGLAGTLTLCACGPDFELIEGEHVLYEYSAELHPCAGNAEYVDRLVPFLEAQTGLKAPRVVRYSWVSLKPLIERTPWRPWAFVPHGSYTTGPHATSIFPISVHELTHAVTGFTTEYFFVEGIAFAMEVIRDGGTGPGDRYPDPVQFVNEDWDPRHSMTAGSSASVNYAVAGVFVTFLLVRHGPERFADFFRGLGGPTTMERIRRQFHRAYGLDIDAEIELFLKGVPPCEEGSFPVQLPECSGPTVSWNVPGKLWEFEASMDCDAPGVIGGITPWYSEPSFRAITLEVTEADAGQYQLWLNDIEQVWLRFGPCFGCPWDRSEVFLRDEQSTTVVLEPGKYYMRIGSESDLAPYVDVQLRR